MDDRFAKLVELAASANREIEYSVERVVVRVAGEEIVAEAAIAPVISPVDLKSGAPPNPPSATSSPGTGPR